MKVQFIFLLLIISTALVSAQESPALHLDAERQKMNKYESQMIEEINLVRTQPQDYIPYVEAYAEEMKDRPEQVKEAEALITYLESAKALSPLAPLNCLFLAARDHAAKAAPDGPVSHKGDDGRVSWDRIHTACNEHGIADPTESGTFAQNAGNENIGSYSLGSSQGYADNAPRTVNIMLLCGGFGRENIFNPNWKYVGAFSYNENKESFMEQYGVTMYQVTYHWIQSFAAGKK